MAQTAADVLIETLLDWDVEVVFGLPGDGINGIMEALRRRADKIRFVQVRHEESAAFMACAYAKYTGKLGVCLATSGPGGIHLLNGLYDAKLDGAPVLAITGMQFHDLTGTFTQQDVEVDKLFSKPASVSPTETPLWDVLGRVVGAHYPGARLLPRMMMGFTDAPYFRERGAIAYGFGLFSRTLTAEAMSGRFHGNDERVDVESLALTTQAWLEVCEQFLG